MLDVEPEFIALEIGQSKNITGQYKNYLEGFPREVDLWTKSLPSVAYLATRPGGGSTPPVTAESPGISLVTGYDDNVCVGDQVIVQVGDPLSGAWRVDVWRITKDNCHPPPDQARSESITINRIIHEVT